jgi:signal transduction histidine kinase
MKKLWLWISDLGVDDEQKGSYKRTLILTNQLNFSMLLITIAILIFLSIMRSIEGSTFGIGSLRTLLVSIVNLAVLAFAYYRKPQIGRFLFFLLPPIIMIILPTLIGFVEEESYMYYPLLIIVFSIIPQLLLVQKEDRIVLYLCLLLYAALLICIEPVLFKFSPFDFPIIPLIKGFFPYLKLVQIVSFLFLHFAIFYLRNINEHYEHEVILKNQELDQQNAELNKTLINLKETQQKLYQAEKMASLGTLTAGVAHEINNPLNLISGGVQLLEDEWKNSDPKREVPDRSKFDMPIRIIQEGISRTIKVVHALISFSGNGKSVKIVTDIHELIENTLLLLNHSLPEWLMVKKEYRLTHAVPIIPGGFQQVLLNIIQNAITAMGTKPDKHNEFLKIRSYDLNNGTGVEYAILEIINSGPSIPEENLSHIFDPFFTTNEPGQGAGLGLAISYSIINDHNGSITAENTGEGVCFRIALPL